MIWVKRSNRYRSLWLHGPILLGLVVLLQVLADLDKWFDAGQLAEEQYRSERPRLKQRLAGFWPERSI